jgi:hypothetical protein
MYKAAADSTCQHCKVLVPDDRASELLNLHHEDGDPSNNHHYNLRVLCLICHAAEPYHGQVGRTKSAQANMRELESLRKEQGIF